MEQVLLNIRLYLCCNRKYFIAFEIYLSRHGFYKVEEAGVDILKTTPHGLNPTRPAPLTEIRNREYFNPSGRES